MILQVKKRDFQQNFRKFEDVECEVIGVKDKVIGSWKPFVKQKENVKQMSEREIVESWDFSSKTPPYAAKKKVADEIVTQAEEGSDHIIKLSATECNSIEGLKIEDNKFVKKGSVTHIENKDLEGLTVSEGEEALLAQCDMCHCMRKELWYKWDEGEEMQICMGCISHDVPPKHLEVLKKALKKVEIEPPSTCKDSLQVDLKPHTKCEFTGSMPKPVKKSKKKRG